VETAEVAADRVPAFRYIPTEQLMIAPGCGMKCLPRDTGKMRAMSNAAVIPRAEMEGNI
jgi:methionine synthase II (cobalamin-independent)